jgi:hypothetical protein
VNNWDRDLDVELARLLDEEYRGEEAEVRQHIRECPCCQAQARMVTRLRIDLWAIRDELLAAFERRRRAA